MLNVKKAAVIGAGTMGSQIAAHLANVGIPTLLLDVAPSELTPEERQRGHTLQSPEVRNRVTRTLFERAKKLSPNPLYLPEFAQRVTLGNIDDNLADVKDADWIVEAVFESLDLKRSLHARVATHARPDALVTTNTSGLSINAMAEGLPVPYLQRFFGAHFFNPPRYLRLLEIIPNHQTSAAALSAFEEFAETVLGKGLVRCKDTPGFVANRIGCFALQHILWLTLEHQLGFDEVDAITGPAIGRPKSATFRLSDIVGIDLMAQISRNFAETLTHDDQIGVFRLPPFVEEMVKRGWWGEKKGQGFYKKIRGPQGAEILTLDAASMDYRPRRKTHFASLDSVAKISDPAERLRALINGSDNAALFAWKHLSAVLRYSADRLPEIADDIITIDRALRWGFNWELGPFETWDALGVQLVTERLARESTPVPAIATQLLNAGRTSFYAIRDARVLYFDFAKLDYLPEPSSPREIHLPRLRKATKIVRGNSGASLIDLGDGVACLEFHTKMNVIGGDQLGMIRQAQEEVRKQFTGLVIGNQGEHFSAGANLLLLTTQIQNQDWDELDAMIRTFQRATSTLRQFEKPIVVACHGYTLGGGCEVALGAPHVVAAAETYMGLPEVGVGLIPAAGGTKEMLIRATEALPQTEDMDYFPALRQAWETIGLAKIGSSAHEALKLKYLRPGQTTLVLNRDRLIGDAKAKVLEMAAAGYRPSPAPSGIPAIGATGIAAFKLALHQMRLAGQISELDQKIGIKLATILCGGELSTLHWVSESYLLDLEREAFLSLCGEPKTLDRIKHMLTTGKPLRN